MASLFEDPAAWRLKTAINAIPYKKIDSSGSFEGLEGESRAVESYLIVSSTLLAFVAEMFPRPLVVQNQLIQRTTPMPGLPFLFARRVLWRAFIEGKPIDPFLVDTTANANTYSSVIRVDVEFSAKNDQEESTDPETFLEISGDPNGEFLHTSSSGGKWACSRDVSPGSAEPNKQPILPVVMHVPTMDWSLRWPRVDIDYFKVTLLPQIRKSMGKVNSAVVPLLFDADIETLLFTGFRYREVYSIVGENVNTITRAKFVNLDLKMSEKRIFDEGSGCDGAGNPDGSDIIRGHNDFWRPKVGWQRLLHDDNTPVYKRIDFNTIFNPASP